MSRLVAGLASVVFVLLLAPPVLAGDEAASETAAVSAGDSDCYWFPDLRCGRSGRYEGFSRPIVTPYLFEDPFITTGVNSVFIWHQFPNGSAFRGGDAYVVAVQARLAITDRLAFIATKDGFMWMRPDQPLLRNDSGFMDISAGLKYALVDMPEKNLIVSPSLRMDLPVGQNQVFQGNGAGVFIPALSAAWGFDRFHIMGDLGGRLPVDRGKESTSIFYNVQADYNIFDWLVPFVALSGFHYTNSGNGEHRVSLKGPNLDLDQVQGALKTGGFEGLDVANLGSSNVGGHDIVTVSFGAMIPITKHISFGAGYERPISNRKDIIEQRVTTSLAYEF